jgi:hypothetical protein
VVGSDEWSSQLVTYFMNNNGNGLCVHSSSNNVDHCL